MHPRLTAFNQVAPLPLQQPKTSRTIRTVSVATSRIHLGERSRKSSSLRARSGSGSGDREDFLAGDVDRDGPWENPVITGEELRYLVFNKWGRSYEVRILMRDGNAYVQIMWKFLEQRSFPMTEEEYQLQLDAVAEVVTEWRVAGVVRAGLASARKNGPGYTGGGGARSITIPLGIRPGEFS